MVSFFFLSFFFFFTELKYTEYKFSHFQVCNSVAFSTFTVLCNHHFYLVPKNFHHHQIGSVKQFLPIPHFPESLETVNLLSISMGLFILDISYKWTHTIYDLCVCLVSLNIMCNGAIQNVASSVFHSFL